MPTEFDLDEPNEKTTDNRQDINYNKDILKTILLYAMYQDPKTMTSIHLVCKTWNEFAKQLMHPKINLVVHFKVHEDHYNNLQEKFLTLRKKYHINFVSKLFKQEKNILKLRIGHLLTSLEKKNNSLEQKYLILNLYLIILQELATKNSDQRLKKLIAKNFTEDDLKTAEIFKRYYPTTIAQLRNILNTNQFKNAHKILDQAISNDVGVEKFKSQKAYFDNWLMRAFASYAGNIPDIENIQREFLQLLHENKINPLLVTKDLVKIKVNDAYLFASKEDMEFVWDELTKNNAAKPTQK